MSGPRSEPNHERLHQLVEQLIDRYPARTIEIIRLGAVPRWLDHQLAVLLFPGDEADQDSLETIRRFRFVSQISPGQLVYHHEVRQYLLRNWLDQDRQEFRRRSEQLAVHFLRRASRSDQEAKASLSEWIYHLLAADSKDGIFQLFRLFEQSVETRELGFAERLVSIMEERCALLGINADWLNYFSARLKIANYEFETAQKEFSNLVSNGRDPQLTAAAQRGLGWTLLQSKEWYKSTGEFKSSLKTFRRLGDVENIVRTQLALGDAYQDLANKSGGIIEESRPQKGRLNHFAYVVSRLPYLVYRQLAERLDFLPNLFGSNYQNWIVLRLLGLSYRAYRQAERTSSRIDEPRIEIEVRGRLAEINFRLARYHRSEQIYRRLLGNPLVESSSYRSARATLGLARIMIKRGNQGAIRDHLEGSLETFKNFGDWQRAGEAAYMLGQHLEMSGDYSAAAEYYSLGITATTRSRDFLRRTAVASALRKLREKTHIHDSLNEEQRTKLALALEQIDQLQYVSRFPGTIQLWFTRLALILAGPVMLITALILALLFGLTLSIMEGEVLVELSDYAGAIPLSRLALTDVAIILLTALTPLLALWIRYGLYVLIGWLMIRFFLPLTIIESSPPDIVSIARQGIRKNEGRTNQIIDYKWDEVISLIFADRCLWHYPQPLFSNTIITGGNRPMIISGITNGYQELQYTISEYLGRLRNELPKVNIRDCGVSLVRHWWLWASLGLGLVLGPILVTAYGEPLLGYCAEDLVNGQCPNPVNLRLAPLATAANLVFIVLFAIGSTVRMAMSSICVAIAARRSGRDRRERAE